MKEERKKALELCRLSNWAANVSQIWAELEAVSVQAKELAERSGALQRNLAMSMLEMEDQKEVLSAMGVGDDEIARHSNIPDIRFDPLKALNFNGG